MSVAYGYARFIDSFRFLSSSSDLLVQRLVDDKQNTLKNKKKEIIGGDNIDKINRSWGKKILNIVNETVTLIIGDRYINESNDDSSG